MIEAKDTVMEGNQIAACYGIKANTTPGILWEDARKAVDVEIATRQAEITAPIFFKAGYDEGMKDNKTIDEKVLEVARQEGRKDVVEWIKQYCGLDFEEAQAQLKEWGIEQK